MSAKFDNYSDLELYRMMDKEKSVAERAFGELYSRYNQRVYAYCLRVTGSHEDANDIFQEIFMKFFHSVHDKKFVDKIPSFLMTIARNLCLNYHRDKKPYTDLDSINMDIYLHSNDEGLEYKELLELISRALDCLDFQFREAFVLRVIQGFSYIEMAEITGSSEGVLKNRVFRAKEKIKEVLQPYLKDIENNGYLDDNSNNIEEKEIK